MTKIFSFISLLDIMCGTHSGKWPSCIRAALQGLRGGKPYARETNPELSFNRTGLRRQFKWEEKVKAMRKPGHGEL